VPDAPPGFDAQVHSLLWQHKAGEATALREGAVARGMLAHPLQARPKGRGGSSIAL
jgi:hypothetical protein